MHDFDDHPSIQFLAAGLDMKISNKNIPKLVRKREIDINE